MTAPAVTRARAYPFRIPRGSFLFAEGRAVELDGDSAASRGRVAVLAYGANASPAALAWKLGERAARARIPVLAAELRDFDVVYSAHVSPYGSIPGTLQHSPGAAAAVHVVHPTADELAALHRSEPNYRFVRLHGVDLRAATGRRVETVRAYVSRHGCLVRDGGHVGVEAVTVGGRSWPTLDEPGMLAAARDALDPGAELEEWIAAGAADPAVAAQRTARLRATARPLAWEDCEETEP